MQNNNRNPQYKQLGGPRQDILTGHPLYNGEENSAEVPDHVVLGSPGGVYAIDHHWSHGIYSPSSNYDDIYGQSAPPYIDGVYGNVYQPGNSAYVNQVFDAEGQSYGAAQKEIADGTVTNILSGKREKTSTTLFEVLDNVEKKTSSKEGYETVTKKKGLSSRPWSVIILFIFGSIALYLALNTWERFGYQVLHHSRDTSWMKIGMYGLIAIVVYSYVLWKVM